MRGFENPESAAMRHEKEVREKEKGVREKERPILIEKYLEITNEQLRVEGERLKKLGFPVGSDCRIDLFQYENSGDDRNHARRIKSEWTEEVTPEDQQRKKNAELLERAKTLSVNKLWFEGRLISVRTSEYDDFKNGVDNLIFDTKTNQPLAAIDDTTGRLIKEKDIRLENKIARGARVKYGIEYVGGKMTKKSMEGLPVFIISTSHDNLIKFAEDLSIGKSSQEGLKAINEILEDLMVQSERGEKLAVDLKLKEAYRRLGKVFGEL